MFLILRGIVKRYVKKHYINYIKVNSYFLEYMTTYTPKNLSEIYANLTSGTLAGYKAAKP